MVTVKDEHGAVQSTFFGLSADAKPAAANGSCFLEMDTGKLCFYDAAGKQWREWGAGA